MKMFQFYYYLDWNRGMFVKVIFLITKELESLIPYAYIIINNIS